MPEPARRNRYTEPALPVRYGGWLSPDGKASRAAPQTPPGRIYAPVPAGLPRRTCSGGLVPAMCLAHSGGVRPVRAGRQSDGLTGVSCAKHFSYHRLLVCAAQQKIRDCHEKPARGCKASGDAGTAGTAGGWEVSELPEAVGSRGCGGLLHAGVETIVWGRRKGGTGGRGRTLLQKGFPLPPVLSVFRLHSLGISTRAGTCVRAGGGRWRPRGV